jgi:hypothetical protein
MMRPDNDPGRFRFIRGLIIGVPISLTLYAAVIWVIFHL